MDQGLVWDWYVLTYFILKKARLGSSGFRRDPHDQAAEKRPVSTVIFAKFLAGWTTDTYKHCL